MAKKKKPTSDPRSPQDLYKPEKKEYYRQLELPLAQRLKQRHKSNQSVNTWHTKQTQTQSSHTKQKDSTAGLRC